MEQQLPVLQILVPLAAAPFCILFRQKTLVMGWALAVCWVTFGISVWLLMRVTGLGGAGSEISDAGQVLTYSMGGWAAPWGIEYRVDALSAFMLFLVSGMGAVVITYAPLSIARELPEVRRDLFYAAFLLCLAGLLGITITGDLFNLFVFLEISALSSYALISLGACQSRRALMAAFQYLVMGTIGATFILIGIGLMYMMTGTLNMADMATRLQQVVEVNQQPIQVNETRTIIAAFAFLTVGIGLKMALFPLHLWLPAAYTYAPSVVSAFLAATATKVSVYILLRFVFTVFGTDFAFEAIGLSSILMPLSLLAMLVASTVAIFQQNVKRMLAYSSVAQIGYMVLGISFASSTGLTAGILHLLNHALTKGGIFLATGCLFFRTGSAELEDFRGLGRRMPFTMFLWVLGGLGLVGMPLTAGFISKWYLLSAAFERGFWPVAVLLLWSSLLALVYVWRVVEVAYFEAPLKQHAAVEEAPWGLLIPTAALIGTTLLLGLNSSYSAGVARQAAELLLGSTP